MKIKLVASSNTTWPSEPPITYHLHKKQHHEIIKLPDNNDKNGMDGILILEEVTAHND